ncbi:dihydrolipoyl dehydrogenase [Gordonia terrae]|uniref:Dihydrolipoyl dehydrogenase n=2 Tax=Gordonia terrae TaxID=2055 RepID=A0AAD0KD85_9ACTN|nr:MULTISPECIES: dihydrolipoyl dehydrogenase [Gordonia]VTR08551.1 dihydrolipoamide dehydrogenase Lpd [Clostridioides difficile]ANY25595.1 dihydrolipoyl dehydrogenase [Gordonia terrae]AWO86338.1 dihydrolipoyl dehydrogenase [Gordonia terrae]VTS64051.1 Dihydrolipoyl dehydrogenase [Gordonia terrae]GAB44216.1 dihydrolipoamide dehydrogenase [Gordonia terrae NBRC 100016]
MTRTPDVVVLGGGSGGYACAIRAAQLGLAVTLIESDKVGGTCLHRGCIPTKALVHAGEVAETIRDSSRFGVLGSLDGVDMERVHSYKNGVVGKLFKGLQGLVRHHGIEVISGLGRYMGNRTVDVDGELIEARRAVVLATGSQPRTIPGLPIGDRIMTSDDALELSELPSRAVVLGGGVIGVEFAGLLDSLGTEVTVVEALPRLVASEDEWSSKKLARAFRKRGIDVRTSTKVLDAQQSGGTVTISTDSGEQIEADLLLVAVGREPRTADSGVAEAGIALDRGHVVVDNQLRTNHDGVWAVGDVVAGLQLAHRGFQQGLYVAEQIAGRQPSPRDETGIPRVTYTSPEIASVGLTEAQARAKYGDVTTAEYDLGGNGKSQILGAAGGIKLIREGTRQGGGPVVGIHMVGDRISELVGQAQLIVNWNAHPEDVAALIHAHPTQSEALGEAHLALAGQPLHAHG